MAGGWSGGDLGGLGVEEFAVGDVVGGVGEDAAGGGAEDAVGVVAAVGGDGVLATQFRGHVVLVAANGFPVGMFGLSDAIGRVNMLFGVGFELLCGQSGRLVCTSLYQQGRVLVGGGETA